MQEIRIKLDFLTGPIWPEYYIEKTETESSGVDVVDKDEKLNIAKKISDMYNVGDKPCVFNCEAERRDRDKMLSLLAKLNERLSEINDGSFIVVDEETPRVRTLKPLCE